MTQTLEDKVLDLLQGSLDPDEMDQMLPRLLTDPAQVEQDLREQIGAESPKQHVYSDVELRLMDDFAPAFIVESDITIELGHGPHKQSVRLRELNMDDFDRLVDQVPDILRYVFKEGPGIFNNWNTAELLNAAVRFGMRDRRNGKPTQFNVWMYEELGRLFSNPVSGPQITASYIRACKPGQIIRAIRQLYAVNSDFFVELWAEMPTDMTTPLNSWTGEITSRIGRLMSIVKAKMNQTMDSVQTTAEDLSSAGTTANGGTTNSSGH